MLTGALCQALIVKKEISPDRFIIPEMKEEPIQCPDDCHACCKLGITLDLTSVESLMIFLLNRGVVNLIEEYTKLHPDTGYCPFMIMEKCIINAYKPTACQMYMPFEYNGEPMCFYLAQNDCATQSKSSSEQYMNSHSYDIHGFMMKIQCDIDKYFSHSFFKNVYEGTLWWENNYDSLPDVTRICLESILSENYIGSKLIDNFNFKEALSSGHKMYTHIVDDRRNDK